MTVGVGSILLSPVSYKVLKSSVFNGTQPSNEGCTNGVSINGQMIINCGQGTTLIDCDLGDTDYSNSSNYFRWNPSIEQVSMEFSFYQQINISRITMFFWNSPSNSIVVPSVKIQFSSRNLQYADAPITINSPNRTEDGRSIVNIGIDDDTLKFWFLKITMTFYNDSAWIFLSEVQFCG